MRLSALNPKYANRLLIFLFLAFALATSAGAETSSKPPSAPNSGASSSAGAKPADAKPGEGTGWVKPAQPTETKSAETAAETKPAPAKPTETKDVEAKPNPPAPQPKPNPTAAQTKPTAPAEQAKPNATAEQTKPNPPAPQPKPGPAAEQQPKSEPAAGEPKSNAKAPPPDSEPVTEQAGSQILINIDKTTQEMTVFVDGLEKYTWPVSTGKRGYSTPSGNYSALSMNETWYSKEWDNAPMPHAIFYMKDGHAIHGSYEVKHLGAPASHGCVRLAPKNAKTLFDLVKKNGLKNTQVVLVGTTPGGEAKVAAQPAYPDYGGGPWPGYGRGNYPPPRYYPPPRRGLFGGWFRQPYGGPQGYYRPPRGYYPPY